MQKTRNARTVHTLFIGLSIFLAAVVVGWPTAPLHATGTSRTVTASGNVTVDADLPSIPALNDAGQSAYAPGVVLVGLAPATGIGAQSTEETLSELLDSVGGRQYWAGVQARNVGGLWSDVASMSFVAGQQTMRTHYLPVLMKPKK